MYEISIKNAKPGATTVDIEKMRKSISNNLSEDGLSYNCHWYRISEAPEDLVEEYLLTHELPPVHVNKNQRKVCKFNGDGVQVHVYKSLAEAVHTEKVSEPTLKKHITENKLLNGFRFEWFDEDPQ
jgi:hypothetical protein